MLQRRFAPLLLLLCLASAIARAQNCSMPQLPPVSNEVNIFTPEQAQMLGDVVAEHLFHEFNLVNDPALNAHLQDIADRMAALSNAGKVRVELIDIPDLNAFTFPGGRVFVARKLVAYAKSEDELAGVLAHEFGHVVTHDAERDMSMMMRKVLNVTSVSDRRDIQEKYNQLIENERRKNIQYKRGESDQEQQTADQIAVWLMARAGYDPQAYTQLWDRWNELKSHTGSWLTDFFGSTKPEAKRLRIALKAVGNLPANCIAKRTVTDEQFKTWQQSVVQASRGTRTASLHNVVSERKLDPALRTDISHMRFSPDGKWFLAQDDASIFVFSREPMQFKFRIDASDAHPAEFSPDSASLVFYDTNYRVEKWSVSSEKRAWVQELAINKTCLDSTLSRDGAYLACATDEYVLRVWEVATGNVVFEKKNIYEPSVFELLNILLAIVENPDREFHMFQMAFSPDAHYFVCARGSYYVAVDMTRRGTISLPGAIKDRIGEEFAFIGDDRIVGVYRGSSFESAVVMFPSGQMVKKVRLGRGALFSPAHGTERFVVRPVSRFAAGVYDTRQDKFVLGNNALALDIYDEYFLSEQRDGLIGLYRFGDQDPIHSVAVPTGPLGRLRAADVSDDFTLLAVSQRSRGAVWDLKSGQRKAFVRGFRNAYLDNTTMAYLDFPEYENTSRMLVQVDTAKNNLVPVIAFGDIKKENKLYEGKTDESTGVKTRINDAGVIQYGTVMVGWRGRGKNESNELVVRDARTGNELWTRKYEKGTPGYFYGDSDHDTLILRWSIEAGTARRIIDSTPALKAQLQSMKAQKYTVEMLEVVDRAKGNTLGYVLVDSGGGSFRIDSVRAERDGVIVADNKNRTLAYSLSSGKQIGRAFGVPVRLSHDGSLLALENNPGQVTLYSLPSMEKRDELTFPSGVAFGRFSNDSKRLFVLTKDHTAYTLRLDSPEEKVAAK